MIKFNVVTYRYDISKSEDAIKYTIMTNSLKKRWMKKDTLLWVQRDKWFINNLEWDYILDEWYLFDNQFNTVWKNWENWYRLWFWSETIFDNKNIKEWYYIWDWYLDIKKAIENRCNCNYCWKQYWIERLNTQCMSCQGSEYMTENNYCLTKITSLKFNSYDKNYRPSDEWITNHLLLQKKYTLKKEINHKKNMIERYEKEIKDRVKEYDDKIIKLKFEIDTLKIKLKKYDKT